jgi:hypothetical protein
MIEAYLHALQPRRERQGHRPSAALPSGPA